MTSISDDFLPLVSEFLLVPPARERAFSWDVTFDEGLDADSIQALIADHSKNSKVTGLIPNKAGRKLSISSLEDLDDDLLRKEALPMKKRKLMAVADSNSPTRLKSEYIDVMKVEYATIVPVDLGPSNKFPKKLYNRKPSDRIPTIAEGLDDYGYNNHSSHGNYMIGNSNKLTSLRVESILPNEDNLKLKPMSSSISGMMDSTENMKPHSSISDQSKLHSMSTSENKSGSSLGYEEVELSVLTFGPMNGIIVGDGCRVGVYSRAERQKRIERFREKKLKRIWRKQIKYDCRKRLADTRPRVKGRFVSRVGDATDEVDSNSKDSTTDPVVAYMFGALNDKDMKKKQKKIALSPVVFASLNTPAQNNNMHTNHNGISNGSYSYNSQAMLPAGPIPKLEVDSIHESLEERFDGLPDYSLDHPGGRGRTDSIISLSHMINNICGNGFECDNFWFESHSFGFWRFYSRRYFISNFNFAFYVFYKWVPIRIVFKIG